MKKILILVLLAFLISTASATTIESESVEINLDNNKVEVDVIVEELTHSTFTYITSYPMENVQVQIDGETQDCTVNSLSVGSEVRCDIEQTQNFTANIEFYTSDLVAPHEDINVFRYSHSVYRPTEEYNLRVLLPSGAALVNEEGAATPIVTPENFNTGSDGRQIYIEWTDNPSLGQNLNYEAMFEPVSTPFDYLRILPLLLVAVLGTLTYLIWRKQNKNEKHPNNEEMEELEEDEIEIIEILKENEGEMLQKDVVDESDYSKAKISGLVSSLVEKEVLAKKKEGRSNKLTLQKNK